MSKNNYQWIFLRCKTLHEVQNMVYYGWIVSLEYTVSNTFSEKLGIYKKCIG